MNGFFAPGHGFVPLEARSEVFAPAVQQILAEIHHRKNVACGCQFPRPEVLLLEVIRQHDGRWRLDRRSVTDEHADGCVFRLDENFEAQPPAPDLVFDTTWLRKASGPAFRHVARHQLSAVHAQMFIRRLRKATPLRPTGVADFLAAFWRRLGNAQAYPFYSLREAAVARGLTLSVGFLRLPCDSAPEDTWGPLVFDTWSEELGGIKLEAFPVDRRAWIDALSGIRIIGRSCTGPYLFVAAASASGLIVKLSLFPIYVDALQVIPVDSHTERKRAAQLVGSVEPLYKPVRLDHFGTVTKLVEQFLGGSIAPPRFRVDFAYLFGKRMIWEEVRGFAPGQLLSYDSHFDRKQQLEAARGSEFLGYHTCEGWLLPELAAVSCPYEGGTLPIEVSLDTLPQIDQTLP